MCCFVLLVVFVCFVLRVVWSIVFGVCVCVWVCGWGGGGGGRGGGGGGGGGWCLKKHQTNGCPKTVSSLQHPHQLSPGLISRTIRVLKDSGTHTAIVGHQPQCQDDGQGGFIVFCLDT